MFSVTVENTYDNIDILGEAPTEVSEVVCEPEETYIIPNCGPCPSISEASSTATNIYTNLLPNNNTEQGIYILLTHGVGLPSSKNGLDLQSIRSNNLNSVNPVLKFSTFFL